MAELTADRIRNVVLLSHGGAGKTVLAEAMLHAAGVTTRMGTIEEGNTASDFEPEESRRQTSIQTAILPCPWRGHKINLLDTPGFADFRGQVTSGVRVADSVLLLVSASTGVEVGTQQMWSLARQQNLSCLIFVSKMDRENADFQRTMDSVTERFGRRCVAVTLPVGAESTFSGVINLLKPDADVPDDMSSAVDAARERLTEAVAEIDDGLATKYLEGESISNEELVNGLKKGVASGEIVPILAGASPRSIGVEEVMDAIVDYTQSPADVGPAYATSNGAEVSLKCDGDGPLAAFVFKTAADPFVGKLSYFRVYSGTFKADSQLWNPAKGEAERVGQVFQITGKDQESVPQLIAGDIGAVAKLSSVLTADTLCTREQPIELNRVEFPRPVYRMAVYPKSKADVDKMTSSLARIVEEDPSLTVTRDPDTLEILLGGLGDMHVDVSVEKMKRKFGVDMLLELPKVAYKETIGAQTKVEYKHKKQTGGHGQYGHVWLELMPLPRGSGFEFAEKVVGGAVPKEYIPSVEKGILKALPGGAVAGYPVVDLKATLVDGSYHSVDSSGICYEIAGGHALTKGMQQATPVLLEPVMKAEIVVPDSFAGDVIGDLNSKRGRIQGMTPQGDGTTLIEAETPHAEMLRYATELRSQTQGMGSFSMEFDHYEEVPQHLVQRVVDASKEREEARA